MRRGCKYTGVGSNCSGETTRVVVRSPFWAPTTSSSSVNRTAQATAIGRRKTVDVRNVIIIIFFYFVRFYITLRPYRAVYYTKTATANCESGCSDSRYSAAAAAAAATVENNIILLMNRNPFGRQSLCISRN